VKPLALLRLVTLAVLGVATIAAQDPPKPKWPRLDETESARARVLLEQLTGDDEDAASAAGDELAALGAGIAPLTIVKLRGVPSTRQAETVSRLLDDVVTAEYAPLVEEHARDREATVRRWSIGWIARHPDESNRKTLERATSDKDETTAFRSSAGLVALGSLDALGKVFDVCSEDWVSHAEFVGAVLPPARGAAAADQVLARMTPDDVRAQVTGLRLLRSLAPKEYATKISPYLDTEQHAIKKEAVNALRAVVDGDPPLEDLSVFQVIDQARKWKERVG